MSTLELDRILTGDCREILPTLPDKSFKLAFADPPYWVGKKYGNGKNDEDMGYLDPAWLVGELRRLAEVVLITPGNRTVMRYPEALWIICWDKNGASGWSLMTKPHLPGRSFWEPILLYAQPGTVYSHSDLIKATSCCSGRGESTWHGCEKPLALLRWIIGKFTAPGDAVLDPVCGSGTTCKAAVELGRHYLGIEIDATFAEKARKRVAAATPPIPGIEESIQDLQLDLDL